MKLKYDGPVPQWLRAKAKDMISRPIDLMNRYIHVTQLLQPAPQLVMMDAHWKELEQSPTDMIPALLGAAWHKYLEGSMQGGFSEQRMEMSFQSEGMEDWTIIGTPDWYSHDLLIDFKTAKVWSAVFEGGAKREWIEQMNIYRYLIATTTGVQIESLQAHVVYTDWTRNGMMRNDKHPRKRWEVINVPVWHMDDTRNFIESRLLAIEAAAPFDICTPEERWERGEKYAVMKKGRKSALKLFDKEEDANTCALENDPSGKGINVYVEHRPGIPVRCNDWCSVKQFCSFGMELDKKEAAA